MKPYHFVERLWPAKMVLVTSLLAIFLGFPSSSYSQILSPLEAQDSSTTRSSRNSCDGSLAGGIAFINSQRSGNFDINRAESFLKAYENAYLNPEGFASECKSAVQELAVRFYPSLSRVDSPFSVLNSARTDGNDWSVDVAGRSYYIKAPIPTVTKPVGDGGSIGIPCDLAREEIRVQLTSDQAALRAFWVDGSNATILNSLLRKNAYPSCLQSLKKELAGAIARYPTFSGLLYRGTGIIPGEILGRYTVGQTVPDLGFLAASKDEQVARERFEIEKVGWLFKIQSRTCHDISSFNLREKEVICLPGTYFRVSKRDEVNRVISMQETN